MGIETNRVKIGKIELPGVDETCLGLKAVGDIADGDWVVKVPRRAMLGWDDAKRSPALRKVFLDFIFLHKHGVEMSSVFSVS